MTKTNRGGSRVAGPGKKIGRPPLPDNERRSKYSIVISPQIKKLAEKIMYQRGYRGWGHAVEEALLLLAAEIGIDE